MTELAKLAVGNRCRVLNVEATDAIGIRLLEMGLTPGIEIAVIGKAPLGDPIELEIRGYRLSVRKSEASRVSVEVLDS